MEDHKDHVCTVCYVCTGSCGAKLTEEEYEASQKACGTTGCTHEGMPFEKKECCDDEKEATPAEDSASADDSASTEESV